MTAALTKNFLPLCILSVLHEHAEVGAEVDEEGNRYLMQSQICELLATDFDMEANRRTVARNLQNLYYAGETYPNLGLRLAFISSDRRATGEAAVHQKELLVHAGWRLAEDSGFETSEIRMLVDAVLGSPMIPPNQVNQLVERLAALSPDPIAIPNVMREGHLPVVNSQFFLNIELLNEAIQQHRYVTFILGAFDKSRKLSRTQPDGSTRTYRMAPLQLLVSKGRCYFMAQTEHREEPIKFRVELMLDVQITEDVVPSEISAKDINVAKFREQHAYMMSGEVRPVKLRVGRDHLHAVYDQFGPNVHFFNELEETIDVSLESAMYSVLFWALQYYRFVEVLEPAEWREELERAGRTITQMYANAPGSVSLAERQ